MLLFIFDLNFAVVLRLSFFFIHIFFSTSSLTLPWTIARFLHPFNSFSSAHRRAIPDIFIFNHSAIFWPRGLRHCVDLFYPQAFFTLRSLHRHLKPAFIKVSLGAGSSSLKFAGLRTDCRNTHPAHLFVWFTVIHNLHVQNDSVLNSTIYYHELLVVKVSFIYSLLVSNSFTCSKTYLKTIKKHFEQD